VLKLYDVPVPRIVDQGCIFSQVENVMRKTGMQTPPALILILAFLTGFYRRLIAIARDEKVRHVVSTILNENRDMRAICKGLGFQMRADMEDGTSGAELEL
jgi:hypothetical protein